MRHIRFQALKSKFIIHFTLKLQRNSVRFLNVRCSLIIKQLNTKCIQSFLVITKLIPKFNTKYKFDLFHLYL